MISHCKKNPFFIQPSSSIHICRGMAICCLSAEQASKNCSAVSGAHSVSYSCPVLGMNSILVLPVLLSWLYSPTPSPQEYLLLLQALIQMQTESFTVMAGMKTEQSSDLWARSSMGVNWLSSWVSVIYNFCHILQHLLSKFQGFYWNIISFSSQNTLWAYI